MSGLNQMQEQYPMVEGAGKEVHRQGLWGFLLKHCQFFLLLAQTCFFFSWEISKESPKPVREDRQRWWEHKAVMCLGVERGPGY